MARREAVRCSIDAAALPASPATSDFTTDSCLCCAASVASRATWLANARGATEGATSPRRVLRGLRTARGLGEAALLLGVAGAPAVGALAARGCDGRSVMSGSPDKQRGRARDLPGDAAGRPPHRSSKCHFRPLHFAQA